LYGLIQNLSGLKKKKITLCTFLLCFSTVIFAKPIQLTDYQQIMTALEQGYTIQVVIHYQDCQLISHNEIQEHAPHAIGGMTIDTFEWFAAGSIGNELAYVVSSENKLIANPRGKGYVYNYAKLKISSDNQVKLTARYIDTQTHATLMDENFFSQINDGKNQGAVYCYRLD